jgi:acyl dehydratase
MLKREAARGAGGRIVLVDSITQLAPEDAGSIVVSGSHGGASSGEIALRLPLAAALFNDAGVGKDGAGIAALAMLQARGVAAAAVSHASARIGDALDAWEHGIVSHRNEAARTLGVEPGERLRDALGRVAGSDVVRSERPAGAERAAPDAEADGPPAVYLEDFEPGVEYVSPPHSVTLDEALDFARRYDPQYFHTDPVAARRSAFGELVCGGFQTAALAWALVLRSRMFDRCALAGIGVDELRWLAPVRPGDTLRCRFALLERRFSASRPDRGVARFRYEVVDQLERTVLTLVITQLLRRRPA